MKVKKEKVHPAAVQAETPAGDPENVTSRFGFTAFRAALSHREPASSPFS